MSLIVYDGLKVSTYKMNLLMGYLNLRYITSMLW
jgi:hypothetical protein